MTRFHLSAALAFGLGLGPEVLAQTGPRLVLPEAPLPEGAIRRFGFQPREPAPAKQPARPREVADLIDLEQADRGTTRVHTVMALTPDGKRLVVADYSGRIDVWDVATGRRARRLQEPNSEKVHAVAVSPDGRWLACARTRPDVQLWDLTTGQVAGTIPLKPPPEKRRTGGAAERVAFAADSKVLYTAVEAYAETPDAGATAWEVPSGKRLWNAQSVGYNLAADPRGRWVLTSNLNDNPIRLALLDARTGQAAKSMPIEPSWEPDGTAVDATITLDRMFTPDGARLITTHGDGTVRAWDPDAGREVARIKWGSERSSGEPGGLACSPDGKWVAVRDRATILVLELVSGRPVYTIAGEGAPVRELAFTRDGHGLISNAGPAPILWSLRPKDLPAIDGPADAVWAGLGSDDAAAAYRLQWALIAAPATAAKVFASRVRPAELVFAKARFDRLVKALDSAEYAERERAERDLTGAGITVPVAWLRRAVSGTHSEEVQSRLRRVLARRETPGPASWRLERAVQVLELAGTAEAVALLKEWAAGPADSVLTDEAAAAVRRVAGRP
jgi:DNA-binding beta-propeller fold protein YncE